MTDIYIRGGWIITMDKERRIIKEGAIAVDNGIIVDIGKRNKLDIEYKTRADIVIEADRDIIIPGLINTHVHLIQSLFRHCADNLPLLKWLIDRIWPLQGNIREIEALAAAKLTVLELIKSGTTTFLETGLVSRYGPDNIIEFLLKSGIRAAVARHVMDQPGYGLKTGVIHSGLIETGEFSLKDTIRLYHKYHGRENRIWIWFGPRTPGAVSIELYREISEKARELGTGITMHLAEIREDVEYTMRVYGRKPVEFAHWVGLTGRNVVLVHVVWIDDDEIKILSETKTNVSHNPSSNMKLGSGIAKIYEMINRGVNVTIGTDGGPSNNTYDLLREMKLVALLQSVRLLNPLAIRSEQIVEMTTINAARALMLDHLIGSIEIGKKADIVILDYWVPHLHPLANPLSHLVYASTGSDVKHVIIDGKIVMYNREILSFNEREVIEEAEKYGYELYNRTGICREVDTYWPIV
ncbi:MAG: amidohydrolase [Desulfurococcaceae archaeon]